jgi:hypothetical protein
MNISLRSPFLAKAFVLFARAFVTWLADGVARWIAIRSSIGWRLARGLAGMVLLLLMTPRVLAHDVPNDVLLRSFLHPSGETLQVLMRVPMRALRDIDHPRRPGGWLDLARADPSLRDAAKVWVLDNLTVLEEGVPLEAPRLVEARVALEADRSFAQWDTALAALRAPRVPANTEILWDQGLLDLLIEFPIRSERARFSIEPRFERFGLRVLHILRFVPADWPASPERAFELDREPGLVHLDPGSGQTAQRFVRSGFLHILQGLDHLLFLLCLAIPFRRFWALAAIATAFTVAHTLTLLVAALGHAPGGLWFAPLVETLIAASIVYMALENMLGVTLRWRWIMAFVFGLVHGFGFSLALHHELQFAGGHLALALLSFNAGVELGQLFALVLAVPILDRLLQRISQDREEGTRAARERIATLILSALVAHTAWHWFLERGEQLLRFPWPVIDELALASLMRWAMAALILAGLVWGVTLVADRWSRRKNLRP